MPCHCVRVCCCPSYEYDRKSTGAKYITGKNVFFFDLFLFILEMSFSFSNLFLTSTHVFEIEGYLFEVQNRLTKTAPFCY